MLNILRKLFSIITAALAGYSIFTGDFRFFAYMFLFAGLSMLMLGLKEFKRNKKMWGWMLVVAFILSLFVSSQYFMLNY